MANNLNVQVDDSDEDDENLHSADQTGSAESNKWFSGSTRKESSGDAVEFDKKRCTDADHTGVAERSKWFSFLRKKSEGAKKTDVGERDKSTGSTINKQINKQIKESSGASPTDEAERDESTDSTIKEKQ